MSLFQSLDTSGWRLGLPRDVGAMTIAPLIGREGPVRVQLIPKSRLGDIVTLYEPSVYRGDGSETRKTLVLSLPEDVHGKLLEVEERIKDLIRPQQPRIDGIWNTSLKPGERYPAIIRTKIRLSDPRACTFVDADGNACDEPEQWHRLAVVPVIEIKGVWQQKTGAGILWETTGLMCGEPQEVQEPPWDWV